MQKLLVSVFTRQCKCDVQKIRTREEKFDGGCQLLVNDHDHSPICFPGVSHPFSYNQWLKW
jgi:hypothetical protein